jgi:hypothetical protein
MFVFQIRNRETKTDFIYYSDIAYSLEKNVKRKHCKAELDELTFYFPQGSGMHQ